ncbi:MAG: NAD(P)/FAD-dependent oxidoreductase [Nocardioidaceae bacterium]
MTDPADARGPDVVVVGAGVSGLTCAVSLLEAGAEVLVRTSAPPIGSVSAVAGAMLGPVFGDAGDPSFLWATMSAERFAGLAATAGTGIAVRRGRLLSAPELGPGVPPWAETVPGYAPCSPEELPARNPAGFWADLAFADMPTYLAWLVRRVGELGGRIEQSLVTDLAGAARHDGRRADVVVNCAGLGAAALAGDDSLTPVWGQHVVVDAPYITRFAFEGGGTGPAGMGVLPHGRRVLLGSAREPGRTDLVPDPEVTEGILERCIAAVPELRDAPVVGVEVGLRPGRPSVRLERETRDGVVVVHDYGHGGEGVLLSWGCAEQVTALALGGFSAHGESARG